MMKMFRYNQRQHGSQGVKLSQHKYATKGNGWIVPRKISNGRTRKFYLKNYKNNTHLEDGGKGRGFEGYLLGRKIGDHVKLLTNYPKY
jgi:hypothetical protein